MSEPCIPRLTPILPVSNFDTALSFFSLLGFSPDLANDEDDDYIILHHPTMPSDIHLTLAEPGWLIPDKNPFGLYLYTDDVDAVAARFPRAVDAKDGMGVIEKGGKPEVKEWGMYEVSLNGPDGVLVRVGWPARSTGKDSEQVWEDEQKIAMEGREPRREKE